MAGRQGKGRRRVPRAVAPYVVLAVALGLTAAGAGYVATTVAARDRLRFQAAAHRVESRMDARMATYTTMLRATDGFFAAVYPVLPDKFRAYADRLNLRRNYPGVFGIGYAVRIPPGGEYGFVAFMRNAVKFTDFAVWPESKEDDRSSIVYLEPLDERNKRAIGYDMYTEPARREAMRRARDGGRAAATGRVELVQDKGEESRRTGFLMYMPVYAGGVVPPTVEERRQKIKGYVYCPFRSNDFFGDILSGETGAGLEVRIYDGEERDDASLLYRTSDAGGDLKGAPLEWVRHMQVGGRAWTVVMAAAPGFYAGPMRYLPPATALGGAGLSVGLFLVLRVQVRARLRAERVTAELRASQAALREAKEAAEAANRLKDEFLATVSHELRTPLNAILGWAQLLSAEGVNTEDGPQGVETILRNARMQAQLIEDLLDVSRIVSGKVRLEARPVDLAEVVRQAVASAALAAEAKGVRLALDGGTPGPVTVSGDPDRLQQVAWNLLSNAIKFTDEGGTIRVGVTSDGSHARLTVADTGIGIDDGFLPHVFERFRQADGSMTRKHGGLGLGLSIVKSLVEMHGGTVRVESDGVGRGATFTVTLPSRAGVPSRGGAAAPARESTRGDAEAAPPSLEGIRVLVVDDDADSRELVRHILAGQRAEVATAATTSRALDAMRSQPVDVLVSDLAMPDEDGYDLIRAVRELPPQYGGRVPAVALSAMVRAEERERALAAGYQLHLPKPVDPWVLTAALAKLRAGKGRATDL